MLRSMFAAVSGLRAHQTMMDVVGNNIANVNTAGYKGSRTTFQETLTQTIRGSSRAGAERAGVNAMQLGLGSQTAAIDGVFTQGASQVTGRQTDMMLQGNGFFVLRVGDTTRYTRAGAFGFDELGNLAANNGGFVQGWAADANGLIDTNQPLTDIALPMGQIIEPRATNVVTLGGNLPADGEGIVNTSISVFDSLGNAHDLVVRFERQAVGDWTMTVTLPDGTEQQETLTFDALGALTSGDELELTGLVLSPDADPQDITLDLGGVDGLVQFGGAATAEATSQDGQSTGYLRDYSFGPDGTITGRFSNGESKVLGAVAIATFNNPAGLSRDGESTYAASNNSGQPLVGAPGTGDRGTLMAGALEMSNVDLAAEFTNLIIAQRGFQANSRGITTSDEMLQELVNLKR